MKLVKIDSRGIGAPLLSVLVVCSLLAACAAPPPEPASLVFTGTRAWTGNPNQPWAEAVAVTDEKIIAVGSASEIESLIGPETQVVSVAGSMLVPGFIDTHFHFLADGQSLASVQLRDVRTPEEFVNRVAEFTQGIEPGEWILNGAWDHHPQHIHPDDLDRFVSQGIIASMQPYHAIDDGRWAEAVIGPERAKTTYAFKTLIDSGAHVAFGSDWYVAPATPLEGIYAAVTRRTLDDANPDGWVPEQKISVEQALRAYTSEGAFSAFAENRKGRIEPGMLADLVLLDRDLTAVAPAKIRETRVLKTVVGGRTVFSE